MKIVLTSDWHLDALTDGVPRWQEIEALVDHSVEVAIQEGAKLYIMGGDLCDPDGWNAARAMAKAIEVAVRLDNAGVASVWVAGNHDVIEDGMGTTTLTPLVAADIAHHVFEQPGEIVFENLHIVGLPFVPTSHGYDPAKVVQGLSRPRRGEQTLVIGHLNLEGISAGSETKEMARGREVFWPLEALRKKWPDATLLGGHYHHAQEFKRVHIIGSLARLRHDEEDSNPSLMILEV
jgi:DNA repair exonuclease SbcCD nuclease subunit